MLAESLDITVQEQQGEIWLLLSGEFKKDQIPGFKEKLLSLINEGNRFFTIDLQQITLIDDAVVLMFTNILSVIKGKGGTLKLIFKNEHVTKVFLPYQHIFTIFADQSGYTGHGFVASIKRRGKILTRKTGVRFSRPVALILLVVLFGWFSTLIFTIYTQNRNIKIQQEELNELSLWKQRSLIELDALKERVAPLEQLGIIPDTLQ